MLITRKTLVFISKPRQSQKLAQSKSVRPRWDGPDRPKAA